MKIGLMIDNWTYQDLLSCLENKKPFSFSRFGDGEWNAIFRKEGTNCDGHKYYKDMGDALSDVIMGQPDYRLGMQNMAARVQGGKIKGFLDLYELKIAWCNADMLHRASIKNNIEPFFKALSGRNTVMIGPGYLKGISKKVKYQHFIEVLPVNCWQQKEYVIEECRKIRLKKPVFSFSASMGANVMIDILHKELKGATLIDAGSVYDPYVGINKRGYHGDIIKRENE